MFKKLSAAGLTIKSSFPLINAVIEGKQAGTIFASGKNDLFVLHKSGFAELFGFTDEKEFRLLLDHVYTDVSVPHYFHIYNSTTVQESTAASDKRYNLKLRKRIQLTNKGGNTPVITLPSGYKTHKITRENFSSLEIFNLSIANRLWSSEENFLENGFGTLILKETYPVAVCYSACVAGGKAEIDIATLPDHRKKGLAKACAIHFTEQCSKKNITANWDCFEENTGSVKTALSCGFKEMNKYSFLSLYKNN